MVRILYEDDFETGMIQAVVCVSHLAGISLRREDLSGVFPALLAYFLPGEYSNSPSAESFLALSSRFLY